ncbi:hypothetical protein CASFOL_038792 [Castilleja foliolosa]|uniref:Uncharacterized protein n=1 Tax=Castilleja foliolosa TaxID=1961234 RepID=A0ABD3BJJ4_9LAMI
MNRTGGSGSGRDTLFNICRAIGPPKVSDAKTYIIDRNSKHMSAYIAYLESDSKEAPDTGTGMCQYEDASYYKKVEDPTLWMDIQTIDSYLRILHLSPEFVGCHPEAKGKYLVLGSISRNFEVDFSVDVPPK